MSTVVANWGPADRSMLVEIEDAGASAPPGFRAGAAEGAIKAPGRPDVAVVIADRPSSLAVVATDNRVRAACCDIAVEHASNGTGRAVILNAGNANACTPDGRAHALAACERVAAELGCDTSDVVPMSTGVIGVPLPVDRLLAAIPAAVADASGDRAGGTRAATAIMTTDLVAKEKAYTIVDEQGRCTIGAMVKGSGMIEPSMATMLGVITTDAPIPAAMLRTMLRQAVKRSFNRISVDACGSTNDTVAVLASGASMNPPALSSVQAGLEAVCADLAAAIVRDGEGVTRIARLTVGNASNEEDANAIARAIAASALFRTALHGADPNWGRILSAMGASGIDFEPERVSVTCGGVEVCRFGVAAAFDPGRVGAAMQADQVDISIDLGAGDAAVTHLVGDLSRDYITINADYTT